MKPNLTSSMALANAPSVSNFFFREPAHSDESLDAEELRREAQSDVVYGVGKRGFGE